MLNNWGWLGFIIGLVLFLVYMRALMELANAIAKKIEQLLMKIYDKFK